MIAAQRRFKTGKSDMSQQARGKATRRFLAWALSQVFLIAACGLMTQAGPASFRLVGLCIGSIGSLVLMFAVLDPLVPGVNRTAIAALKLQMAVLSLLSGGCYGYFAASV